MLTSLQLALTAYLVGLIWLIQLIHYPAFRAIAPERWQDFHQAHTAALGLLAGGPMILSLLVGCWLAWTEPSTRQYAVVGLEVVAWIVTFTLSVPQHTRLAAGPDAAVIDFLIATNWIRTIAWSLKLGLLLMPLRVTPPAA
jgi:hypothetical protein